MRASRFLLDTNTCIYTISRRPAAVFERVAALRVGDLAISSITGAELAFGVAKSGAVLVQGLTASYRRIRYSDCGSGRLGRQRSRALGPADLTGAQNAAQVVSN